LQRGEGKPAAGGIPHDQNFIGRGACVEEPAIRGNGVLERSRERMLGRQPVVDRQHVCLRRGGDPPGEMPVVRRRAGPVGAAMQEQHVPVGMRNRQRNAIGAHLAGVEA